MSTRKGPKRIAFFIIFLIPVAWYLFIQLFGNNNFALELQSSISEDCSDFKEIVVVTTLDSLTLTESNYMNRVVYGANKRKVNLEKKEQSFFDCINHSESDLVLLSDAGLWGVYELSRAGVDQLLTEIDILVIQESYGKGTKR
ncbi:MAG: hypothetical protein AB8B73_09315 [Ekhidna sp.]